MAIVAAQEARLVGIGAGVEQEFNYSYVTVAHRDCRYERGVANFVLPVYVAASLQQELDHFDIAVYYRSIKG